MTSATGTANAAQSRIGDSLLHGMVVALVLTVVQRFSGLFRGVLFCWFMDEAELGLWSLTQSWLFMLAPMAVFGITGVLRRYVEHYRSKGQLNQFLRWSLGVSAGLTFLASFVLASGATTFSTWMFQDATQWQLIRLMSMTLAAVVVFNTLQDLADSFKMLRIASWMRLLHSIAFTVVAIVAILCFEPSVNVVTTSFLVATLIAILPGLWVIKAYRGERAEQGKAPDLGTMWSKIGQFAGWLWVLNIVSNLFEISDRYMILLFAGGTAEQNQALVGQLHSSRVIPLMLLGLATLVSNSLLPYLVTHWERGEKDTVAKYLDFALKLGAIVCTGLGGVVLVASPILFETILGGRYNDGLSVLPFTLIYCSWLSLFFVAEDYLYCCEKGRLPTLSLALGLVANLGLNGLLIPTWGLGGAAMATMIANWVALCSLFFVSGRNGWQPSKATIALCLLPLTLVLGGWIGLLAAVVLMVVANQGYGLSEDERGYLASVKQKLAAKLGRSQS